MCLTVKIEKKLLMYTEFNHLLVWFTHENIKISGGEGVLYSITIILFRLYKVIQIICDYFSL